jgi:colicin import membrane protein
MRPRKYPLDPLARLREKRVGDATRLLSDAIRARQEAERAEDAAQARRDDAVKDARATEDGEERALKSGELRAEDLARGAAWKLRAEAERAELDERLAKALSETRGAQVREVGAQDGVARARADAEVVARDRAKWEEAGRKKDEAAEEDSVDEALRGKLR